MNSEQIKSLVRQAMLFIAGIIGGTTFVSKFFTTDQVVSILTSDTVIGIITSVVGGGIASAWALISRSDKNMVAAADAVPGVQAVSTKPTVEGRALAQDVPSPTVVPAGSTAAENLASR